MKTIKLRRNKGWSGRMRKLTVVVDDEPVGLLRAGETLSVEVDETAQRIWGRMDWARTERLLLESVRPGQTVNFDAHFTFNPLRALGALTLPFRVFASD